MNTVPLSASIPGEYFLLNNELKLISTLSRDITQDGIRVYEVLRVMNGVCLFLEDHYERFRKSCHLAKIPLNISLHEFKNRLYGLTVINRINNGNIRIENIYDDEWSALAAWFIPHNYPSPDDYKNGVPLEIYRAERKNPNAKQVHRNLKEQVAAALSKSGAYEILLENDKGCITEGSRSNFFVIASDTIITPPANEVLEGITRKFVLELCSVNKLPCLEKSVPVSILESCQAAFISGTSPKILPVKSIGKRQYSPSHPLLSRLMGHYDAKMESYIQQNP